MRSSAAVVNAVLCVFPCQSPWYCVCRSGQVRSRAAVVNAVLDVFPRLSPWYCVCRSGQVRSRAAVVNAVLDVFPRLSSWYCVCRSGRVRSHAAVVNAVLDVFPRLSPWWKADDASVESKMTSLTLLMKLLSIDASVLSSSQHPSCDVIWSMYTGLLTDSKTTLAFKV